MALLHDISNVLGVSPLSAWLIIFNTSVLVVVAGSIRQCYEIVYNFYFHPLRKFPGPWLWIAFPILRAVRMVRGDSEFAIRKLFDKYGDIVRVSPDEIYFIDAQAWKDIYGHGHAEFPKFYPDGVHMDPRLIISSNQQDHSRYRRAMLPAFSDKALIKQEPLIRVYVDLLIQRLREVSETGQWTNIVRWFNFTTFDLIADLAFGESLQGLEKGHSNAWIEQIEKILIIAPVFALMGASKIIGRAILVLLRPLMEKAKRQNFENVTNLVKGRLTGEKQLDRGDFMDFFLRTRGKANGLSDDELSINSDILMLAGSETTATVLSAATYFMLKTPHVLKCATDEVREAFASDEEISFNEVRSKLPYMIACLEEALRLFPPVPFSLSRSVPGDFPVEVCGHAIPPKTVVGVHHLSAYTSEVNFHRAREYLPERWLSENTTSPTSPFYNDRRDVHKPFSFGPRDCIGRNLAYHEMRLIMAKILFNFDLRLDESCRNWDHQRIFGLWEKPPLKVYIRTRADRDTV